MYFPFSLGAWVMSAPNTVSMIFKLMVVGFATMIICHNLLNFEIIEYWVSIRHSPLAYEYCNVEGTRTIRSGMPSLPYFSKH